MTWVVDKIKLDGATDIKSDSPVEAVSDNTLSIVFYSQYTHGTANMRVQFSL